MVLAGKIDLSAGAQTMGPAWSRPLSVVFCGLWIALMAYGWILDRRETAATKRAKAVPRALFGGGLFVAAAFLLSGLDWRVLWIVLPVSLIFLLNFKNTYYCDSCNSSLYNHGWPSPMSFCPKCGALLKPPVKDDPLE